MGDGAHLPEPEPHDSQYVRHRRSCPQWWHLSSPSAISAVFRHFGHGKVRLRSSPVFSASARGHSGRRSRVPHEGHGSQTRRATDCSYLRVGQTSPHRHVRRQELSRVSRAWQSKHRGSERSASRQSAHSRRRLHSSDVHDPTVVDEYGEPLGYATEYISQLLYCSQDDARLLLRGTF